jgi:hypothetical protein
MLLPAVGAALYGFVRATLFRRDTTRGVLDIPELRTSEQRRPRARPAAAGKRSSTLQKSGKGRVANGGDRTPGRGSASLPPVAADPRDPTPEGQLAFHARLGNALDVVVGVGAHADGAELEVQGIDGHTELRMRPTDLEALVARAAALLEREPAN